MSAPVFDREAIFFDLDGVLLPAQRWHYTALNRALEHFGYPPIDDFAKYDGLPTRVKLEMLGIPEDDRPKIVDKKQTETLRLIHTRAEPNIVHRHALAELRADGYLIGVISNAVRATVYAALWRTKLAKFADLVLSNEEVTKAKPDPEIYEKAKSCIGRYVRPVLAVEDSEVGCASARGAGIPVMHVKGIMEVNYERITQALRGEIATC